MLKVYWWGWGGELLWIIKGVDSVFTRLSQVSKPCTRAPALWATIQSHPGRCTSLPYQTPFCHKFPFWRNWPKHIKTTNFDHSQWLWPLHQGATQDVAQFCCFRPHFVTNWPTHVIKVPILTTHYSWGPCYALQDVAQLPTSAVSDQNLLSHQHWFWLILCSTSAFNSGWWLCCHFWGERIQLKIYNLQNQPKKKSSSVAPCSTSLWNEKNC